MTYFRSLLGIIGGVAVGVTVTVLLMPPRVIAAPDPDPPRPCERLYYL